MVDKKENNEGIFAIIFVLLAVGFVILFIMNYHLEKNFNSLDERISTIDEKIKDMPQRICHKEYTVLFKGFKIEDNGEVRTDNRQFTGIHSPYDVSAFHTFTEERKDVYIQVNSNNTIILSSLWIIGEQHWTFDGERQTYNETITGSDGKGQLFSKNGRMLNIMTHCTKDNADCEAYYNKEVCKVE